MDIVTHAAAGVVLGSPLLLDRPETAAFFAFGSVVPDLDTMARVFGKMSFMKCHQTLTHSFFGIVIGSVCIPLLIMREFRLEYTLAFALGMLLHTLFDWSNSYGVMLLCPFSRTRYCRHELFFIDMTILTASMIALTTMVYVMRFMPSQKLFVVIAAIYAVVLALYIAVHLWFHVRAKKLLVGRKFVLIPSAFLPWQYFGAAEEQEKITPFKLNVLSGKVVYEEPITTFDTVFSGLLTAQPEYRTMSKLLPMYRTVEAEQDGDELKLTCRELAIRNFGGRFGTFELTVDTKNTEKNGIPRTIKKEFHV